jgi:hypothetical protein
MSNSLYLYPLSVYHAPYKGRGRDGNAKIGDQAEKLLLGMLIATSIKSINHDQDAANRLQRWAMDERLGNQLVELNQHRLLKEGWITSERELDE